MARVRPLGEILTGEPDANAEYFIARKAHESPAFIRAYYDNHISGAAQFAKGTKFILIGQKGTGKTAILRHLEHQSRGQYKTDFVLFKKEILEESDLASLAVGASISFVVDEEKIKQTRFFHHAMKRLLLSLLLARCNISDTPPENHGWIAALLSSVKNSSTGEIASYVSESIWSILTSANLRLDQITDKAAEMNASRLVKQSNDIFTRYCFQQIKKHSLKCRIFLDEMHFAYKDHSTLASDAALVRDTVLAAQSINERLIEEGIDSTIFMSIRSEFLEHAEIATADINHTIHSYG